MAVREGLLVLLAERPRHGYELKTEFERRTGSLWALNTGQVYTTLERLLRDGLVEEADAGEVPPAPTPAAAPTGSPAPARRPPGPGSTCRAPGTTPHPATSW